MEEVCRNCHFYNQVWNNSGYCKFNAPVLRFEERYKVDVYCNPTELKEQVQHNEYPTTTNENFCGQFKKRVEAIT